MDRNAVLVRGHSSRRSSTKGWQEMAVQSAEDEDIVGGCSSCTCYSSARDLMAQSSAPDPPEQLDPMGCSRPLGVANSRFHVDHLRALHYSLTWGDDQAKWNPLSVRPERRNAIYRRELMLVAPRCPMFRTVGRRRERWRCVASDQGTGTLIGCLIDSAKEEANGIGLSRGYSWLSGKVGFAGVKGASLSQIYSR